MTEFLTFDHIYHAGNCEPLLSLPFPPRATREMLIEAQGAVMDFMSELTPDWQMDGVALAKQMHRAADRLAEIAMLLPNAPDDDEEIEPPASAEEDEDIQEEIPSRPLTELADDRLGEIALTVEASFERLVGPFFVTARWPQTEKLYFALALADQLTNYAMGMSPVHDTSLGLDPDTKRAVERAARRIAGRSKRAFEGEIGFGPMEPPAAG